MCVALHRLSSYYKGQLRSYPPCRISIPLSFIQFLIHFHSTHTALSPSVPISIVIFCKLLDLLDVFSWSSKVELLYSIPFNRVSERAIYLRTLSVFMVCFNRRKVEAIFCPTISRLLFCLLCLVINHDYASNWKKWRPVNSSHKPVTLQDAPHSCCNLPGHSRLGTVSSDVIPRMITMSPHEMITTFKS